MLVGIVLWIATQETSRRRVEAEFGRVDPTTAKLSEGTGVVPAWVSGLNLLGMLAALVGVVLVVIGVLS